MDISDRRIAEEERATAQRQLAHMARHDLLTGLPNRRRFVEKIIELQGRAPDAVLAVFLLDLDRFKTINDTLGHPAGDKLLQQVSERLAASVRVGDLVARFGGDEFAIIAGPLDGTAEAEKVADRILEIVEAPYRVYHDEVVIGTSIGIAMAPTAGTTAEELIKAADIALYEAKGAGGGRYKIFAQSMEDVLRQKQETKKALEAALREGQFELHYQPIVGLSDRSTHGFEALLRWRHPQMGLVSPDVFIGLAEESGLIVDIGAWVVQHATLTASKWDENKSVAVNFSPVQFRSKHLINTVVNALEASGLPSSRLQIEITETVLLDPNETNMATLRRLKELGVKIALDDFGTGYSSLGYLRNFQFDKIKLDRSFIKDLPHDKQGLAIARAVAGLGKVLGIRTTAEGIETQEQLEVIERAGFDEAQGFFLGVPRAFDCFDRP